VHPAPGHGSGTLVNALLFHLAGRLSSINGILRPGIVHRLDAGTTGAICIAKNDFYHRELSAQFRDHKVKRVYYALVHGYMKGDKGTIDANIGRNPKDRKKMAAVGGGRRAVTLYKAVKQLTRGINKFTLVKASLVTGRTHQIRVHMSHIGHPIVNDAVYGGKVMFPNIAGPLLHSWEIGFKNPGTGGDVVVRAPFPGDFNDIVIGLGEV
jgi:23S rRNA pseudouridine1911/1915/1917 synthase